MISCHTTGCRADASRFLTFTRALATCGTLGFPLQPRLVLLLEALLVRLVLLGIVADPLLLTFLGLSRAFDLGGRRRPALTQNA